MLRNEIAFLKDQVKQYKEESRRFSAEAIQNRDFLKRNEVQTTEMVRSSCLDMEFAPLRLPFFVMNC